MLSGNSHNGSKGKDVIPGLRDWKQALRGDLFLL